MRRRGLVPEVTLVQISRGEPLARYLRYEALNPIQIFALTKPDAAAAAPAQSGDGTPGNGTPGEGTS